MARNTEALPPNSGILSAVQRSHDLESLAGIEFDILIVGGGATGAGAALDAASRGLKVVIVDRGDWAKGTSSRSSKLVHGGLRYLEMLDFALVSEALAERGNLLSLIAPHLVHEVPFLYPLLHHWERPYIGSGLTLYDTLSRIHMGPGKLQTHTHLTHKGVARVTPALKEDSYTGGLIYRDAGVDDARLVMTLVRTAKAYDATCLSYTNVESFTVDASGKASGAVVTDTLTGASHTIHARHVIVAAGPFTGFLTGLLNFDTQLKVTASKGAHIVVPRSAIESRLGMIMRTETSVLFVIPWGEFWLVGTTDTPWDFKDGVEPSVTETDIDYLLDHVNRLLARPLTRADIVSSFAGLRPLVAPVDEKSTTSSISREHSIVSSREGVALIAGGKLTTYRVMAKDVVDYALKDEQHIPRCRTRRIPLIGSQALDKSPKTRKALASTYKVTPDTVDHLLSRYGDQVNAVLDLTRTDRSLLQELPGVTGYILAEVVYACQFEGALTLEDVLTRRLRVSMETCDRGASCARLVAEKMSMILNWPQGMADRQVVSYLTMLDHTRNA